MFLMVQLPEIKPSIQNGELDLSQLVAVQNYFRIENQSKMTEASLFGPETPKGKMSKTEKLKVINSVIGKTAQETVRTLSSQSSAPQKFKPPDQVKPLSADLNEVRITLSNDDLQAIKELRNLLAHKNPNATLSEIVSLALTEAKNAMKPKKTKLVRYGAKQYSESDDDR